MGIQTRRAVWIVAVVVLPAALVLAVAACRWGVPVVDPGQAPPTSDGTISGRLMTPGDASRLPGRRIEVINVETGSWRSVSSNSAGAFTVKVPPGKYRLQVELRPGEAIVKAPETIDINPSDLDSDIVIEIAPGPTRPHPADSTRGTEGLGAPIA